MIVAATAAPDPDSPGHYRVTLATPGGEEIAVLTLPADAGAALAGALAEPAGFMCCHLGQFGRCPDPATHLLYDPEDALGSYSHACEAHVGAMAGRGERVYLIAEYGAEPPAPVDAALHRVAGVDTGEVETRVPRVIPIPPGAS